MQRFFLDKNTHIIGVFVKPGGPTNNILSCENIYSPTIINKFGKLNDIVSCMAYTVDPN